MQRKIFENISRIKKGEKIMEKVRTIIELNKNNIYEKAEITNSATIYEGACVSGVIYCQTLSVLDKAKTTFRKLFSHKTIE